MKKLLIGCGIVTLILITLVIGGVIYVTMKVRSIGEGYETAMAQFSELDTKYTFVTPGDGSLDSERLDDYFAIRNNVIDMVSENPTVQKMVSNAQGGREDIGFREILGVITRFIPEVMNRFHDEMDSRQMPPAEYAYNARVVYTTISKGNQAGDQDMMDIYEDLVVAVDSTNVVLDRSNQSQHKIDLSQTLDDIDVEMDDAVHQANMAAVKRHQDDIAKDPSFAFIEFVFLRASQGGPVALTESSAP